MQKILIGLLSFLLFIGYLISCGNAAVLGDMNNDGRVGLGDAILVMQVSSGMNPAGVSATRCTVSGDSTQGGGRIGLDDALYVFQRVAGMRGFTSDASTQILVTGDNPRSGVEVGLNTSGDGIVITNTFRRHLRVLVYRTGYVDWSGETHPLAWEALNKGTYVSAVNAIGGVLPTIIDYFWGNVAYGPVSSVPIPLPMYTGAEKVRETLYTVIVAGAGQLAGETLEAGHTEAQAAADLALRDMKALEAFKELFLPLLFTFLDSDDLVSVEDDILLDLAWNTIDLMSQAGLEIWPLIDAGDYKNAMFSYVKALMTYDLAVNLLKAVAEAGLVKLAGTSTKEILAAKAKTALKIVDSFDKAITLFDAGVTAANLASSGQVQIWQARAVSPMVQLRPNPASVAAGGTVKLTATAGGETGSAYRFDFSTAGSYGTIAGGAQSGTSVAVGSATPGAAVVYTSSQNARAGDAELVSVAVTRLAPEPATVLGEATTTVTVAGTRAEIDPAHAEIAVGESVTFTAAGYPAAGEGDRFQYKWYTAATLGHLTGDEGMDDFTSEKETATYQADTGGGGGSETVQVEVLRKSGGQTDSLGVAKALVTISGSRVKIEPASVTVPLGGVQTFTASVVPAAPEGVTYGWTCTDHLGKLTADGAGASYTAGDEVEGDDTIMVEAFRPGTEAPVSLGKAGTLISVRQQAVTISPAEVNWGDPDLPGAPYFYKGLDYDIQLTAQAVTAGDPPDRYEWQIVNPESDQSWTFMFLYQPGTASYSWNVDDGDVYAVSPPFQETADAWSLTTTEPTAMLHINSVYRRAPGDPLVVALRAYQGSKLVGKAVSRLWGMPHPALAFDETNPDIAYSHPANDCLYYPQEIGLYGWGLWPIPDETISFHWRIEGEAGGSFSVNGVKIAEGVWPIEFDTPTPTAIWNNDGPDLPRGYNKNAVTVDVYQTLYGERTLLGTAGFYFVVYENPCSN